MTDMREGTPEEAGFDAGRFELIRQRGAEWAATGKVTQTFPVDFPKENAISVRKTKVAK